MIRFHVYNLVRDSKREFKFSSEEAIQAEIDAIADREWMLHISQLAWDSIEPQFSDQVKDVYIRLSHGECPEVIAGELELSRGSIYVYKERVQKALRREVRRLDSELG